MDKPLGEIGGEENGSWLGSWSWFGIAVTVYVVFTVCMFSGALFSSEELVLSNRSTDIRVQFAHWRYFGFEHLSQGNLPLWNPHIFSGAPFFGGFQSAMLYPPNFLYLILPLAAAINIGITLHVILGGVFMYLWMRYRGLHPLACLLGGVLLMFCGAHYLHIHAGHLPNLCTMIWAPLLFLCIDATFRKPTSGWWLLGVFVVTMMCLAGHPQYVFHTAVAALIYSAFRIAKARQRKRIILALTTMAIAGALLSAVQLLTGIEATGETVRGAGLSYQRAGSFSFPPENVLTFLAPALFGDVQNLPYWGRVYIWEACIFLSVTGLVLAAYALFYGNTKLRGFSGWMVLILLVLALGSKTPLHRILYHSVPGFNKFRGMAKFIYPLSLFAIMLAGVGLHHLIQNARVGKWTLVTLLITAAVLGLCAVAIWKAVSGDVPAEWWTNLIKSPALRRESYLRQSYFESDKFISKAGLMAANSLLISAGTFLVLSLLLYLRRFSRGLVYAIALLAMAEMGLFARHFTTSFPLTDAQYPELKAYFSQWPGDYRVVFKVLHNTSMSTGTYDLWGNDPSVLTRYAELMTFTQGKDPDKAGQYLTFKKWHPLYRMFRLRFAASQQTDRVKILEIEGAMPILQLIGQYLVLQNRDKIFKTLAAPEFDPRRIVILESAPNPKPIKCADPGTVRLVEASTDHLTIEADLACPSILLITDTYSKNWRAEPLPGSVQQEYHVMPANYALRAIPLDKGHHLFRVDYVPRAFVIGKWISIVSALAYAGALIWYCWSKVRRPKPAMQDP